jgi:GT2 family glycosyltransferase
VSSKPVVVVIPHHHRVDLLQRALSSVEGYPALVVDDSVEGLSPSALEDCGLSAEGRSVLRASGSSGFATVANLGLAAASVAGFQYVLLLNDDTQLEEHALERLLAVMRADTRVGAVGPVLIGAQGVESAGLSVSRGGARVRHRSQVPSVPSPVDALSGACLLVESSQRFDPRFSFYFEDVDLCSRLRGQGKTVVLVPDARCHHVGGATIDRRSREAAAHAVAGHLQLVGRGWYRRAAVVALALAQIVRERGPLVRVRGVWDGVRAAS